MKKITLLLALSLLYSIDTLASDNDKINVKYVDSFENFHHPQIVYWAWDNHTIKDKQYLRDVQKMVDESPFNLAFITSRFDDGIGLFDTNKMKPYLEETVDYAHQRGFKIGLQVWSFNRTGELMIPDFPFEKEDAQILVAESSCKLDATGKGKVYNNATDARSCKAFDSDLITAYLFKETGNKEYDLGSLIQVEDRWMNVKKNTDYSMDILIEAPSEYAGYTVYVMTSHYFNSYDVFSPKYKQYFKDVLDGYADIPFDGTALDEHGSMAVKPVWLRKEGEYMTCRVWGNHFASFLKTKYSVSPVQLLFDMRYAPKGKSAVRIKAINTYFTILAQGNIALEQFFYDYSKKLFGKDCFAGVHTTFHNSLQGDDIWCTGVDWWDIPRDYGHSDEDTSMPERLGIGMSGSKPVMYNMYYHKEKKRMYEQALNSGSYGVRIHYHSWNDSQGWGKNVEDNDFLEDLKPVEYRIRMLNWFNPVEPKLPLLIIYNFPYQFNWYPDYNQRNIMDIRNCNMQSVARSVWNAGYACASIPDGWIEKGLVSITKEGKVKVKDRIFEAVLFLNPQYARESSFRFMEKLINKRGKLSIQGTANRDFNGKDCTGRFLRIAQNSNPFDPKDLSSLSVKKNPIKDGIVLKDGSVIMSNYSSVETNEDTPFAFELNGHTYTGSYQGVFALRLDKSGEIERLVCGNFKSLQRDGQIILASDQATDICLEKVGNEYNVFVKDSSASCKITIHP